MDGHSIGTRRDRRQRILRKAGWLAAASLLAVSIFAPSAASATEPAANECAADLFEYSADGGPFRTVVVNDVARPYPMISVVVRAKGDLPEGCTRAFSLASYETDGGNWPESGTQTFLDHDTATLSAQNPSATLSVTGPECFGQTDFYTSDTVNGTYWPGSTKYDGVEGPLPHYPNSPTPYGKIAGSEGGYECVTPTPTPTDVVPTPTPTDVVPTPTPTDVVPTPTPTDVVPTPTPTDVIPTPTPTDVVPTPTATDVIPTPTPTDVVPTPTGSDLPAEGTPTPTGSDLPAAGTPTPNPTGEELGVIGTPALTPPATDIASIEANGTEGGWRLVLAGIVGLMAVVLLQPARLRTRRNR